MWNHVPQEVKESFVKRIPLGRFGTPQEVARVARFLIVDGDYMTGSTISINGGLYMS